MISPPIRDGPAAPPRRFATTRWTMVLAAGRASSPEVARALADLCRTYWYPLYAYVRRRGHQPADAQDLTQEFFARLLARDAFARVHPEKGRFRSFLLASMNHFLADVWDKSRAQKRGAGQIVALDVAGAEARFLGQPAGELSPEKVYEQRWALALLEEVHETLRREYVDDGRGELFEALRFTLAGGRGEAPYAELAARLAMSEGAVKVAAHRLRQHYRKILRARVADTVAAPGEVEEELRYLLRALAVGG